MMDKPTAGTWLVSPPRPYAIFANQLNVDDNPDEIQIASGIRNLADAHLMAKALQMYSALWKIAVLGEPYLMDEATLLVQLEAVKELAQEAIALEEERG